MAGKDHIEMNLAKWLNVALDMDRWRAVVNRAVSRCVLWNAIVCRG